jgi:hypothetical protein
LKEAGLGDRAGNGNLFQRLIIRFIKDFASVPHLRQFVTFYSTTTPKTFPLIFPNSHNYVDPRRLTNYGFKVLLLNPGSGGCSSIDSLTPNGDFPFLNEANQKVVGNKTVATSFNICGMLTNYHTDELLQNTIYSVEAAKQAHGSTARN